MSRINCKIKVPVRYSRSPSQQLKGDWLKEAAFDTGRGVTVKITEGCLTIIADRDEIHERKKALYQVKQANDLAFDFVG
ncbi:type I addiction module toxin, SymE family [Salmonella enterica]|nr:type I addiction module toxin, SymE family [Salmonella enterica]